MVRFSDVVDWVDGKLDGASAARVADAVQADAGLLAAAAWYRDFRSAAARMPLESPPPEVHDLLMRRFALYRPPAPGFLERIRAVVAFDSATAHLALGVRAAGTGVARHLVVESDALDVALDLYPEDRLVRLEGQVLPADQDSSARGRIRLSRNGEELTGTESDDAGRFAFAPVEPGPASLSIEIGGVLVEVDIVLAI